LPAMAAALLIKLSPDPALSQASQLPHFDLRCSDTLCKGSQALSDNTARFRLV